MDGISDLEQFKKFCSRRYVAARAVAAGFGLGQYVYIQATAPKARPHQPSALPDQRLHNFLKCSSSFGFREPLIKWERRLLKGIGAKKWLNLA